MVCGSEISAYQMGLDDIVKAAHNPFGDTACRLKAFPIALVVS